MEVTAMQKGADMEVLRIGNIELSDKNKRLFRRPGLQLTGETITIGGEYDRTTHVVFKGKHTPYMTVRDCGDHYIFAGYSQYYRIDKDTLQITNDVEDR